MAFFDPAYSGVESERLTTAGAVAGGVPIVLYGISLLSGAAAGTTQWYEDSDAATAANRRGGITGPGASSWNAHIGYRQKLSQCFMDLDANSSEVIIHFRRQ